MKTIEINLYKFNELSEEAQQTAIEKLWDINITDSWWDGLYDDAENVGVTIKGFDIGRGSYCNIEFDGSPLDTAHLITINWGDACDEWKLSEQFIKDYEAMSDDDDFEDVEDEYRTQLSEVFLQNLRNEYEYLTSKEAIIETIEANEYDFTEDGRLY